ncbi:general substrate transporter [Mytilinidion resinicola]|uniref:General substrate transporter n=1 Tax=Mytilinidion resinicola TaxID=574789 RepID=A0A6A6Z3T8_9PEZI|nr:general substrate transporter [Mytilinidion resinicola]KAF2815313.1 general substrate transporter [Mytilinidion resinicola]
MDDPEKEAQHIEAIPPSTSQSLDNSLDFQLETLSYGKSGLPGILSSGYVFAAAGLASMGGFSFGYDQGVVSIILTMPQFHDQYLETRPGSAGYGFHVGFMTGMLELGAFLGCLVFPKFADVYLRKWGLVAAVVVFCLGAIIQTASQNYGTLVAGRTIGGIGVGTLAMGAPLYISEVAPPNVRGSLLVLEAISIVVGAIISYWITYATKDIAGDWAFRLPFVLQMVPALCLLAIMFFPYSPRWLVMRGRNDDSLASLSKLRRLPGSDHRVQAEWKAIITEVKFQEEMTATAHPRATGLKLELAEWFDLFRPKYIRRTAVALAIPFFQQFSGINAFVYYAPTFFAALGQDAHMSLILSGMVNICQLVAAIPTFLYLDRMGRRKLAIFGGIAMGIPHTVMAGIVGKFNSSWTTHTGVGWFGVALIYIYILCYAVSYGPLAWCMPAEVFPNHLRAKGVGAATATIWLSNFVIGVSVPPMMISIGYGTYIFFACFCFAAAVFSYFLVPETSGMTLEQMDIVFKDNSGEVEAAAKRRIARELQL